MAKMIATIDTRTFVPHWRNNWDTFSALYRRKEPNDDWKLQLIGKRENTEAYVKIWYDMRDEWIPCIPNKDLQYELSVSAKRQCYDKVAKMYYMQIARCIHDEIHIRIRERTYDPTLSYVVFSWDKKDQARCLTDYWAYVSSRISLCDVDWNDPAVLQEIGQMPRQYLGCLYNKIMNMRWEMDQMLADIADLKKEMRYKEIEKAFS